MSEKKERAMSLRAPEARPEEVAHGGTSRLAAVLAAGMARLSLTPTAGKKKEGGHTNKDGSGRRPGGRMGGHKVYLECTRCNWNTPFTIGMHHV